MKKAILITTILLIPLVACPKSSQFRMGDHLMKRGEYEEALEEYQDAQSEKPDDPQVLWRLGAALTRIALDEVGKSRHDHLEEAVNLLNRAIVADSDILMAHLEYARALGYMALFKPDWDDVRVARRVREELNIVLGEEPESPDANFLMGLWHRWVSSMSLLKRKPTGLGQASCDSVVCYLNKALEQDEDNLLYKYELAQSYLVLDNEIIGKGILRELADMENVPEKYERIPREAALKLEELENPPIEDKSGSGEIQE